MSRWEWVIVKKKILIYVDNLLFLSSYIGVLAIVVFLLQIITIASQRDKMKGEYFVHGFTLAMTAQNRFYRSESEKDIQGGYVDIFMLPMTGIWKDMKHSYIIEMKYARNKDNDEVVARLREEAIAQANRYADTEVVRRNVGMTALHKIVVVYRGMEMVVCEEV